MKRLGIETAVAKVDTAAATRSLGGEVTVPEGRMVTVTAPVAGTVSVAAGVQPGARVSRGARLMTLAPLASSERDQSIEARRAVEAAQADADTARLRLQRLEQLLKDGAASVRSVEEARGQLQVAEAALNAARERLAAFRQGPVGPQGEIAIAAPLDGVVQSISAAPGQTVAASAPLLQIAQVSTLWVRVPVFAGDADQIDAAQPASVTRLGGGGAPRAARRVTAPLRADPAAASVDLYYELPATASRCALASASWSSCRSRAPSRASSCPRPQCSTTSTATRGSMKTWAATPTRAGACRLRVTPAIAP